LRTYIIMFTLRSRKKRYRLKDQKTNIRGREVEGIESIYIKYKSRRFRIYKFPEHISYYYNNLSRIRSVCTNLYAIMKVNTYTRYL